MGLFDIFKKKEKIVAVVSLIVLVFWLVPGFLSFLAPESAAFLLLDRLTATTPLFFAIVFLAIFRIDGEPILDLKSAFKKVDWLSIVFLAGILMIAGAMGEETTGIGAFIASVIVPLTAGKSAFILVGLIAVLSCIITNIANNIPVGIILVSVTVPIALDAGINPFLFVVAICIGANLAYTIPPAFVPIGIAYSDEWCEGKKVFLNGLVMTVISCVVLALLMYPLGNLVLGV